MQKNKWESPEQLNKLICELVSWDSQTGTKEEIEFPYRLKDKLLGHPYFKENPDYVQLHDDKLDRLAFQPETLTKIMKERKELFSEDVKVDIGRDVMDIKMGLALHMHLLEQASDEKWPINLLLVTVPGEEVDSAGMRAAINNLTELRDTYHLSYKLFLSSEPSFTQTSMDDHYYIYSRTIGKIMPSAICLGW